MVGVNQTLKRKKENKIKIICCRCGRDINAIGQDNMSYSPNYALCEDCAEVDDDICEMYSGENEEDEY